MEERIEIISKTILEFQDSGRTSNDALARIIIGNLEDNGYELKKLSQHDVSGRSELLRDYFKWHKEQGFVSHKDCDIDEFLASNCH